MNSNFSKSLDTNEILDESISIEEVFSLIEEEYSIKNYGKNKFNIEVLYWIGYIYRYFSYTYELSSRNVYKIIKPKELNELYYVYHTFDPSIAISRILEEKNISFDVKNQNEKLLEMLKERKYQEEVEIFEDNFNTNSELYSYRIVYDEEFAGSISLKKIDDDNYLLNIKINEEYNKKIFEKVVIIKLFKVLELKIKNKFIIVKFKNDENERIDLYKNLNFNYLKEDEEVYFKRKV